MHPLTATSSVFNLARQVPPGRPEYYRAALSAIASYAGTDSLDAADLSADFINGFVDWLIEKGKSQHTVAAYFRALRAMYNSDVRNGLCPRSNAFKLPSPTVTAPVTVMPESVVRRLANHDFGPLKSYARVRDLIMFSFYTRGVPISVILMLRTDAVTGTRLTLPDKTQRLITSPLADIIARYRDDGSSLLLGNGMPTAERVDKILGGISRLLGLSLNPATFSIQATWESVARAHHIDPLLVPDNAAAKVSDIISDSRLRWWAIVNNDFPDTETLAAGITPDQEVFIPRVTIAVRTPNGIKYRPDPAMRRIMFIRSTETDIDAIQQKLGNSATVMFTRNNGTHRYTPVSDHDMHIFRLAVGQSLERIDGYSPDDRALVREQHVIIVGHPLFDGIEGYIDDIDAARVNISVRLPLFQCRLITPKIHREFIRVIP